MNEPRDFEGLLKDAYTNVQTSYDIQSMMAEANVKHSEAQLLEKRLLGAKANHEVIEPPSVFL